MGLWGTEMRLHLIVLLLARCCLFGAMPVSAQPYDLDAVGGHIPDHAMTNQELLILKHGDRFAAGQVMKRLWWLGVKKGRGAVQEALPPIAERWWKLENQKRASGFPSHGHGEEWDDYADFLTRYGDGRVLPALLGIMSNVRAPAVAIMRAGPRAIRMVVDSLNSTSYRAQNGAAFTLLRIDTLDAKVIPPGMRKVIRERLEKACVQRLGKANAGLTQALAHFGDEGSVAVLRKVAEEDPFLWEGRYLQRMYAQEHLDQLLARLEKSKQK